MIFVRLRFPIEIVSRHPSRIPSLFPSARAYTCHGSGALTWTPGKATIPEVGAQLKHLVVSPDGSKLAYVLDNLYVVDVRTGPGSDMRVPTKSKYEVYWTTSFLEWSWDSERIALARNTGRRKTGIGDVTIKVIDTIEIYDAGTGSLVNTVRLGDDVYMMPSVHTPHLKWSADNKHLVFIGTSASRKKSAVYSIPTAGGAVAVPRELAVAPQGHELQWVVVNPNAAR